MTAVMPGLEVDLEADPDTVPGRVAHAGMLAASRAENHAVWQKYRWLLSACRARAETTARRPDDPRAAQAAAAAFAWSSAMAAARYEFAHQILERLPMIGEAMRGGALQESKAAILVSLVRDLDDAAARLVIARVLDRAPLLAHGALTTLTEKTAADLDPAWHEARRRAAEARARVVARVAPSGAAELCGLDLPLDPAREAYDHVVALADAIRAAARARGAEPRLGEIQSHVYLRLLHPDLLGLDDTTVVEILTDELAPRPHHDPNTGDDPDDPGPDDPGPDDPGPDDPDDPGPDGPEHPGPDGRAADGGAHNTDDADAAGDTDAAHDTDGADDADGADEVGSAGEADGGPEDNGDTDGDGDSDSNGDSGVLGAGPDDPESDTSAVDASEDDTSGADPEDGDPGSDTPEDPTDDPDAGTGADPDPCGTGALAYRPGIVVRLGLGTLLGHDQRPGEAPGWGAVATSTARTLARHRPDATVHLILHTPEGVFTDVLALPSPGPRRGPTARHRRQILELTTTPAALDALDPTTHLGEHATLIRHAQHALAALRARPPEHHPARTHRDARRRHPRRELDRHIRTRDRHCRFPGCPRPAITADLDHTHDWQYGGLTQPDNLGALCRYHHRLKTDPDSGWRLAQPRPGHFVWTSPQGAHHTLDPPLEDTPLPPHPPAGGGFALPPDTPEPHQPAPWTPRRNRHGHLTDPARATTARIHRDQRQHDQRPPSRYDHDPDF